MTEDFPATEAAQALAEIEGYDETLTARTFGLNLMVFALAIAAIPISYTAADPWLTDHSNGALAVLWLPWIAGAVIITATLWSTHSITLGHEQNSLSEGALGTGFTVLFFVIAAVVSIILGSEATIYIIMGITGGILTAIIGVVFYFVYNSRWVLTPMVVAGTAIVLASIAIRLGDLSLTGEGFALGLVQGCAYFVTGWIITYRG
ncbi:hypothetical protein HTZ84_16645 [Haloterrigena sp. SYSU A558-1]|uniref:Uncharacterized protein n=1 Tax=Haloterrigena gelatinilytica TaxID=2741724 RepID=A0A8J8KER7_9EURY|nr:hypothetical protein [Haloterrigena gelatinilytica]NUB90267.1 hypothetical protein [Haloterrigena gelatinilytica]NUC73909.1 hypothetical protein [Haloterrigena gelatinilytica]